MSDGGVEGAESNAAPGVRQDGVVGESVEHRASGAGVGGPGRDVRGPVA